MNQNRNTVASVIANAARLAANRGTGNAENVRLSVAQLVRVQSINTEIDTLRSRDPFDPRIKDLENDLRATFFDALQQQGSQSNRPPSPPTGPIVMARPSIQPVRLSDADRRRVQALNAEIVILKSVGTSNPRILVLEGQVRAIFSETERRQQGARSLPTSPTEDDLPSFPFI